jgi:hypothetical protein
MIILFDSIHQLLKAEKILKENCVWHEVVPTPRDLSSDCGSSIKINEEKKEIVEELFQKNAVKRYVFSNL